MTRLVLLPGLGTTGRLFDPMFADASGCIRTPEDPNTCIRPSVCNNSQDVIDRFGSATKLFQHSAIDHSCDPEDPSSCAVPPPDPETCLEESP